MQPLNTLIKGLAEVNGVKNKKWYPNKRFGRS